VKQSCVKESCVQELYGKGLFERERCEGTSCVKEECVMEQAADIVCVACCCATRVSSVRLISSAGPVSGHVCE